MYYGDHLLWLSIILLIALGLLLSLIVLRKLLGDLCQCIGLVAARICRRIGDDVTTSFLA